MDFAFGATAAFGFKDSIMKKTFLLLIILLVLSQTIIAQKDSLIKVADVLELPVDEPDAIIHYGKDSLQFGDLRIPKKGRNHPVVVIIHGGCWLAEYDHTLMDAMATHLTRQGYATWNMEYRRVGDIGGGWPNTFLDVTSGLNNLKYLADKYELNLRKIVVVGHSAGGHLALWLAGKDNLLPAIPIADPDPRPLPISGVVSLAGIVDLSTYLIRDGEDDECGLSVDELIGGAPEVFPDRYRLGSPIGLLPTGTEQILITGKRDDIVPISHINPYLDLAIIAGEEIESVEVDNAGHFELIAPGSVAWPLVEEAIKKLSKNKIPREVLDELLGK